MPEIYEHQPDQALSIIVPVFNEREALPALLSNLARIDCDQIIIVDGGSEDGSFTYLQRHWQNSLAGREVLAASRGRAMQMNAGAKIATGDVLLFLHADSELPPRVKREVSLARDNLYLWGRFDVRFHEPNILNRRMRITAYLMNLRSRLTSIATGDQGIFVERDLFFQIGGFSRLPLMEDVDLSKRLKKHGVPFSSSKQIITSARRWEQDGWLRTIVLMWSFRLAFFAGVSAEKLVRWYRNIR